ncbi:MAG: hypothetical protein WAN74_07820 [Thermoplasmata archaeon]
MTGEQAFAADAPAAEAHRNLLADLLGTFAFSTTGLLGALFLLAGQPVNASLPAALFFVTDCGILLGASAVLAFVYWWILLDDLGYPVPPPPREFA